MIFTFSFPATFDH